MTSVRLIQLLLVLMNPNLINDQALFERLGVQGSASLPHFDDMYEEILLLDDEDLVAAQEKRDKDVGSASPSDAGAEDEEDVGPKATDWDE
jgi:hypothetical protein